MAVQPATFRVQQAPSEVSTADLNDAVEPLCTIDKLRDELEPIEEELSTIGQDVADINVPAALRRRQTINFYNGANISK